MTRYETILEHPKHGRFLFMYLGRRSRNELVTVMLGRMNLLQAFTESYNWYDSRPAALGLWSTSGWTIEFSGRTERIAKAEGELTWYTNTLHRLENDELVKKC